MLYFWSEHLWHPGGYHTRRRRQFTFSLWATLYNLVEHFHQSLKVVRRAAAVPQTTDNWTDHLPWVLLGPHSMAREDDNTTPTQAVFSSLLILPGQFLDSPESSG
jgi:hypothetical protein